MELSPCPLLFNDNLHEERWRAGRLAMPITDRSCNLLFLQITQCPVGKNRHTLAFDFLFSFELIDRANVQIDCFRLSGRSPEF
jgi:hypothetical protein